MDSNFEDLKASEKGAIIVIAFTNDSQKKCWQMSEDCGRPDATSFPDQSEWSRNSPAWGGITTPLVFVTLFFGDGVLS